MIPRSITDHILGRCFDRRAIVIQGPRRAGKTTLVAQIVKKIGKKVVWFNGDETDDRELFSRPTSTSLKALVGNAEVVVIDEAQRIENIGVCIKLLVDSCSQIQVIATGSSSFELANRIKEPLTGRKWEYALLPFSYQELVAEHLPREESRLLSHRLLFGAYPEVVTSPGKEREILHELADSYLYKDILTWERVGKPHQLEKLLKALALQLGQEVSYNELGKTAGLDNQTVERYIDLLEKTFVVFRLPAFARNVRTELKKSRKIYFHDLGIRNAVINTFTPLENRSDTGSLWENYLIVERMKLISAEPKNCNRYFWRTTQQQEIDYIEESDGRLGAWEFKWNSRKTARFSMTFLHAYPNTPTTVITPENYSNFLMHT